MSGGGVWKCAGRTGHAASAQCWSRGAASPRGGRRCCGERVKAPLVPPPSWRPSLGGTYAPASSTRGVSGCGAAQRSPGRSMGDPGRQDPNWATRWCPAPHPPPRPFPTPNPSKTRSSPPPPISVSSRMEEWVAGGGVAGLNHSCFCSSGGAARVTANLSGEPRLVLSVHPWHIASDHRKMDTCTGYSSIDRCFLEGHSSAEAPA